MRLRSVFLSLSLPALGVFVAGSGLGCNQENPYSKQATKAEAPVKPPKVVGIDPTRFECTTFLSPAEVSKIVGGEVTFEQGDSPPQEGVPRPCTYILPYKMTEQERKAEEKAQDKRIERAEKNKGEGSYDDALAAWGKSRDKAYGVNFDCRPGAHQRTLDWIATLPTTPADPGTLPPDSSPPPVMKEITLGKRAVVYAGALAFLDEKTPCAVTITAPDDVTRQALAQVVHDKLAPENAPMMPRAVPQ